MAGPWDKISNITDKNYLERVRQEINSHVVNCEFCYFYQLYPNGCSSRGWIDDEAKNKIPPCYCLVSELLWRLPAKKEYNDCCLTCGFFEGLFCLKKNEIVSYEWEKDCWVEDGIFRVENYSGKWEIFTKVLKKSFGGEGGPEAKLHYYGMGKYKLRINPVKGIDRVEIQKGNARGDSVLISIRIRKFDITKIDSLKEIMSRQYIGSMKMHDDYSELICRVSLEKYETDNDIKILFESFLNDLMITVTNAVYINDNFCIAGMS